MNKSKIHCLIRFQDAEQCGFYNRGEVDVIHKFVDMLLSKGVDAEDVIVLTLYDCQRKKLLDRLPKQVSICLSFLSKDWNTNKINQSN